MPHVTILGGGISGLSLAWFLRQAHKLKISSKKIIQNEQQIVNNNKSTSLKISIIESTNRTGGWVRTERIGGHILERGPRGFRPKGNGIETLKLIESLGLQGATIAPSTTSNNRFVYHENQLQPLPSSLKDIFLNPPPVMEGVVATVIKEPFKPKNIELKDESIYDFISRRFSKKMATTLIDAMISGIYSGDIKKLSVRSCSPLNKLWEYEQSHGSIVKGMFMPSSSSATTTTNNSNNDDGPLSTFVQKMQKAPQVSFIKGMEHLTETLTKKLASNADTIIYTDYECVQIINESNDEGIEIHLQDANDEKEMKIINNVDHIFSTIPANKLSNILPSSSLFDYAKELLLNKMKYNVNVAVVNLVYNKSNLVGKDGFGYLVPSMDKEGILGVAWDSSIFPAQIDAKTMKDHDLHRFNNTSRVTVMIGGAKNPDVVTKSNEELIQIAIEKVTKHLNLDKNVTPDPELKVAGIMYDCIPQYYVGHYDHVEKLKANLQEHLPELTFIGTSFYGVGIADCIANAKMTAEEYVNKM